MAGYGQFPAGIIVGILLARGAYSKVLQDSHSEKKEIRNEKNELRETIQAQQKRIDELHNQIFSIETE